MSQWLVEASKRMSTDTSFTDCVILVGATTFKCHKLVLSNASDFFKRMFLGDFKESMSNQICLKDVTPTTFNIFREYVYTYEKASLCEHSTQTISELFVCGKRWLVPSIIEDCLVILTERAQSMDVDELIDLFQLGHNFENKNLINDVSSILTSQHQKDLFCDKVLLLSYHAFSEYISITSKFKSEIERYNMIAKFLEMNGFLNENESANDCSLKLNDSDVDINSSNDETNNVESECRSKKEDCQMNREKFVKDLLGNINFTKMSGSEFYEGPGKSKLLTLDMKYEILYKIQNRRINYLNIILNQYRAR